MPDSVSGIPYNIGAPSKTALDTMTFSWGDPALANANGTTAFASGTDPISSVTMGKTTPPETFPDGSPQDFAWWEKYFAFGPGAEAKVKAAEKAAAIATGKPVSNFWEDIKPFAYGAIVVVIGLFVVSRGFGLLGEEGSGVIVDMANPVKYPGIGHAVQHFKKGTK
jgi:hypothetical protein